MYTHAVTERFQGGYDCDQNDDLLEVRYDSMSMRALHEISVSLQNIDGVLVQRSTFHLTLINIVMQVSPK